MRNALRNILTPPTFPTDERKNRSAHYMHFFVTASIPILLLLVVFRAMLGPKSLDASNIILLLLVAALVIVWITIRLRAIQVAGYTLLSVAWLACTFLAWTGSGIHGSGFVSYFVVMLLAGLLLGVRAAFGIAILSILSGIGLALAEVKNIILPAPDPAFQLAAEIAGVFILSAILIRLIINSLQDALAAANANANKLLTANEELTALRDALELRIQERTTSLERRAAQLQTVSSLARTITSMQDLNMLLPIITDLVSEQFGFYHVGIFLLDELGENAVLKAANSEGGKRMLDRKHFLPLDSSSIVGYVTSRGEPRIVLDVGADSVYFNNPDLPRTRSEMAVPLRVTGRVIGALDVQSTETNAFSGEDILVLSTLADQIAIAIENARLFGNAQTALSEAQSTFAKYVKQEWNTFAQQMRHSGFVFDGKQVTPADGSTRRDQSRSAIQTGSLVLDKGPTASVSIPVKLRGQTIGVLDVRSKKGPRDWTREEVSLLEAAAERAALALENARLLESAQRRAARERAIGEISARVGTFTNVDSILQAAVEELGRKIGGGTEVTIELGEDNKRNPSQV